MEIKYDQPIEVTKEQYDVFVSKLGGVVAHRKTDDGKYFIKVWSMEHADLVEKVLTGKDQKKV